MHAPNSNTFGCREPRAYLDVDTLTNYSTYNTNGKDNNDYIKTNFSKVRIISIRNKKHEMVDKIDLSDFKFATGNKSFKIETNNQSKIFVDAAPFGVAMNNNVHHQSQLKIDLRSQPFRFKFNDWGKFGDQSLI